VRIDGAADGATMGAICDQDLGAGTTAQFGGGGQPEIAEMIAVKGPIAADDLARLEGYLLSRYGLK